MYIKWFRYYFQILPWSRPPFEYSWNIYSGRVVIAQGQQEKKNSLFSMALLWKNFSFKNNSWKSLCKWYLIWGTDYINGCIPACRQHTVYHYHTRESPSMKHTSLELSKVCAVCTVVGYSYELGISWGCRNLLESPLLSKALNEMDIIWMDDYFYFKICES